MRTPFALSDTTVHRPVVSLILVLVLALVPVACGSGADDDLAVAGDLIEQWMAGWNDNDPDTIAAAFTENGVFINGGVHELSWTGRDEIRTKAAEYVSSIGVMELTGPVTMTNDGTFRCTITFRAGMFNMVAENEFTVDDGLIARLVGHDELATSAD